MANYSKEMSEKIMNASPNVLREIADEMEMEVYQTLTNAAKTRLMGSMKKEE